MSGHLSPDFLAEVGSLASVRRAVEDGIGGTILPLGSIVEELGAQRLRAAFIDSPRVTRRVVCATNVPRPPSVAATTVTALVCAVVEEMVKSGAWPAHRLADLNNGARPTHDA